MAHPVPFTTFAVTPAWMVLGYRQLRAAGWSARWAFNWVKAMQGIQARAYAARAYMRSAAALRLAWDSAS